MIDLRAGLMLAACGLVAGCGLGIGGDDGPTGFDALEARGDELTNAVENLAFTDPASLPTSGAATYTGVIGLNLAAIPDQTLQGQDLMGELSLTANFAGAGDQVTGRADGFVGVDQTAYAGTLIIDDGAIDRLADPAAGDTFTADLAGVLTAEDGTAWTIDAALGGDFAGIDQSHVLGGVAGDGCATAGCTDVEGSFVAER